MKTARKIFMIKPDIMVAFHKVWTLLGLFFII